jgi:hypothetical protein
MNIKTVKAHCDTVFNPRCPSGRCFTLLFRVRSSLFFTRPRVVVNHAVHGGLHGPLRLTTQQMLHDFVLWDASAKRFTVTPDAKRFTVTPDATQHTVTWDATTSAVKWGTGCYTMLWHVTPDTTRYIVTPDTTRYIVTPDAMQYIVTRDTGCHTIYSDMACHHNIQ